MIEDHGQQPSWREIYQGGSEQAEQDHFRDLADRIVGVQQENERRSGSHAARRTFHAKIVIGVDNAELAFPADLPAGLRAGDFTAGARLPVTVRLSNASGAIRPDSSPDLRGAALKITLPGGTEHDKGQGWRARVQPVARPGAVPPARQPQSRPPCGLPGQRQEVARRGTRLGWLSRAAVTRAWENMARECGPRGRD